MEKEVVMFGDVVKGTIKRWRIILVVICLTTIAGILLALSGGVDSSVVALCDGTNASPPVHFNVRVYLLAIHCAYRVCGHCLL